MSWKNLLLRKDWRHNKVRNSLSSLSILLGVGVLIATIITVSSTKGAFLQLADSQSSGADLIAASVNEQQIQTASFDYQNSDITDSFPFFSEDCYFENGGTYHDLSEMAVDFAKESEHDGYTLLTGSIPKNGECLISETMKTQYNLRQGDTITFRTESGKDTLTVSGITQNTGIAAANFGNCILVDYRNMPGDGNITYKLIFRQGTDVKAEKRALQNALKGRYTVDYPAGQTEAILSEANQLFDLMMGFGVLTLLLGGFLINVTVNEYVRKMRQKIATLKVLGAVQGDIVRLVLGKSFFIGLIGVLPGTAVGIGGSFGLIRLVDRSFTGSMDIHSIIHVPVIVAVSLAALLFCLLVSLPAAFRAAGESIVSGFFKYDKTASISVRRLISTGAAFLLLIAGRLFLGNSPVAKLFTYAAVITGIYLLALTAFVPCARLILKAINNVSPFNGFAVKNNLFKQSRKTINLAALFSFVIAISVAITLVVGEISGSVDGMEKGQYFGDAVVSSLTGQGFSSSVLKKIRQADGVKKAYPIYQKYVNIGSDTVQVKGFCLDQTNQSHLTNDWMIDASSLQKLNEPDTILLSSMVMHDGRLKVGDFITINAGTDAKSLKIIGSYNSMNNDGKNAILSDKSFLTAFSSYSLRAVNVLKNSQISFTTLKSNLSNAVNDSFIQVNSSSEIQKTQAKQNDQFIMLINCMIFILIAASILLLVNSISMNIRNNQYALSVTKLLGATSRNLVVQSCIEGIFYGIFGALAGTVTGVMLNVLMTARMNGMDTWNLKLTFPIPLLILCGIGFLFVALFAEIIATALNYRSNDKAALVQE